jgi:hypothetical protein
MSTNKVYGDKPNTLNLVELETRYDYADVEYVNGINENFSIDQSKHSLFGASKVAADVMVQEYGRYFDIPTCCLRGGCLTGENHSGVELHGFLNYLVKCNVNETKYNVFGYKGKQVRDNIHSSDLVNAFYEVYLNPRCGEVYNIGGGRYSNCSLLEAATMIESITGNKTSVSNKEKANEYKKLLPAICFSGTFTKRLDSAIEEVCLSEECRFNRQTYSKIEGNIKSITNIRKSVRVEQGYKTCIVTVSANVERFKNTIEFVVDGKYDLKHGEIVEFVGSSNQEGNLFVFNYYDGKYVRIIQHRIATKWQKYMLPSKPSVLKAQVPEGQMQSKELLLFLFVTNDVSMKSSYTDNELKSVISQIPANTRRVITRHINIMR